MWYAKRGADQGVKGLGMMVNPWSDGFGAAWTGLGKLGLALTPGMLALNSFASLPGLDKGELGRTLEQTGKGLVAWDTWRSDPARALGASLTNIVTAVVGTKGAGAALKGGTLAKDAGVAGRLAALPRLADVRTALAAQLAKFPKIELPTLSPALAGGGAPGRFHFDVERPTPDTSRMHNEANSHASAGGADAGGAAAGGRFVSRHPLEAETANTLNTALPGRVQRLRELVRRPDGSELTDFDIVGDDFVVEVASGGGAGKSAQMQTIVGATDKRVAVFGPKLRPTVTRAIEAQGVPVFRSWQDLIDWVSETEGS